GLLHPSSGTVKALGYTPAERDHRYLRRVALVMGNRRSLAWDLPALDSYELRRAIYSIPPERFRTTRDELVDRFGIGDLVSKPVRNLSLGERMKVELVGSLLHEPELLFLDEPTLGLDVSTQLQLRRFIAEYGRRTGASVILTSHYMADVQALAERVIVIAGGRLVYEGRFDELATSVDSTRILDVTLTEPADLSTFGEVIDVAGNRVRLRIERSATARTTARLMSTFDVVDLTVADPPIEEVVARLFDAGAE
ncbi:MAG: ABC transporter, partial [Acidimicrobiaceae bacterium]|nr:ABC transporter [Acidimicrobiaceae bacterium]